LQKTFLKKEKKGLNWYPEFPKNFNLGKEEVTLKV